MVQDKKEEKLKDVDFEDCQIIVYNDDVTPIDMVIMAFMMILGHTFEQAEQLTMLIHFKGKASVKKGTFEVLQPLCENLINSGLNATIE